MDEPVEKPGFDPTELLGKLERVVSANRAPEGGGKSWLGTLIIIAVVLVAIAAWAWWSNRSNAELAKLRHEREKQRILADKAAIDAQVTLNDKVVVEAQKKIEAVQVKLDHIDADIKAEEERYAANLRAIDRIRSWRDVDPSFR